MVSNCSATGSRHPIIVPFASHPDPFKIPNSYSSWKAVLSPGMPIAQIGREIFCKGQIQLFLPDKPSTERIAMSASNPFLQRALRFCEVCGLFVGNMNVKEWDQGHCRMRRNIRNPG
jgi:hypothetical protein